jgi:hypothetical protein
VHQQAELETYDFVQVVGVSNVELQSHAKSVAGHGTDDGLLWLCYLKKSSKAYKGSDCSRESVMGISLKKAMSQSGKLPLK